MHRIKTILKNVKDYVFYGSRRSSAAYIHYLKAKGMAIGEGTTIFAPRTTEIDESRPWMIQIGKHVQITRNVTILTHGYDWSVIKGKYGDVLGSSGKVTIGDNVFIGMNSTILKGVTIGENTIIGAGSLVTHDIPPNCVAGGVPARKLCSLAEYAEKRRAKQREEAVECFCEYYHRYGVIPQEDVMSEFFWLFSSREESLSEAKRKKQILVGNYEMSMEKYRQTEPEFASYEEFVAYCKTQMDSRSI